MSPERGGGFPRALRGQPRPAKPLAEHPRRGKTRISLQRDRRGVGPPKSVQVVAWAQIQIQQAGQRSSFWAANPPQPVRLGRVLGGVYAKPSTQVRAGGLRLLPVFLFKFPGKEFALRWRPSRPCYRNNKSVLTEQVVGGGPPP